MSLSYAPLDSGLKQIPLLTIAANEDIDSLVVGSLRIVSLLESPSLEALSYAWGNPDDKGEMIVDGSAISMTSNLATFFRRLRQESLQRQEHAVWCDYVCINQQDDTEKASLIMIMGEIYQHAVSVVAWLGELTPDIEQAIAYNDALHGQATLENLYWFTLKAKSPSSANDIRRKETSMLRVWNGAFEIMSSPYWVRLWTFQEWFLPAKRPICPCGPLTFELWNVFQIMDEYFAYVDTLMQRIEDGVDSPGSYVRDADWSHYLHHLEIFASPRSGRARWQEFPLDVGMDQTLMRELIGQKALGIGDLLRFTTHRDCSVPLDRIYALYMLAPSTGRKYPPNYRKTIQQVIHETTTYIINFESGLDVFKEFAFFNDSSIPSWCDSVDNSCTGCRGAGHSCTFDIPPGKRGPRGRPKHRNNQNSFPVAASPYSPPATLSSQHPHYLTVLDRYSHLSNAVATALSFSKSFKQVLQECTDLFFSYIVPFNMSVHEPKFRRSLYQTLAASPHATTLTQVDFTLLTAVCAKACFFMPPDLFPIGNSLAEIFLEASRSCLAVYAETDLENPCADSITIRYLHSNCLHTNAKPMIAWHVFGEALRLVQRMRLHDENSYASLDPVEAEMRRRAFWQVYAGDKSLGVLRSMPISITDYAFENRITAAYPLIDDDGLTIGTNAGIRLWQYAADLILRVRLIHIDKPTETPQTTTDHATLSELYIRFATCLDDLPPHLLPESAHSSSSSSSSLTNDEADRKATRFSVQTADLHITYHSLKMYLTRKLEETGYFSQYAGESNEMLILRKTEIAGDMVRLLQTIPFWSLQVNGEPCAEKIRLVGASLLALMQEPSSSSSSLVTRARRDFNVLLDILSRLDSKASDALRRESS
ncbi:heterokaryon incompatibility protein-domain-containing protein [Aspergillus pseudoustus]|uniref:Heterokaryon incompatibility protein-domain-containing protein n=1 Tax=Aspergillus pseudoustus TaxID=1810923 RepID=A0ABR4K991_9EURO